MEILAMDQTNHAAETSTRNADTTVISRRDILLTAGAAAATGLLGGMRCAGHRRLAAGGLLSTGAGKFAVRASG